MKGASVDLGRALSVFEQVADLDEATRQTTLDELCRDDPELKARVQAMLAADASASDPFDAHLGRWGGGLAAVIDGTELVGRIIGAWKIVALAGRGGMGNVYEVERADGAYRQRAALKLIRTAVDSSAVRERFLRERQIMARLRHEHIATLLDGGFTGEGDPYFVMEYVEGVSIDRWCNERKLNVRARVELFMQVVDAISYAHRNLLVHRDLKPSNLLVDSAGRIKLLDFGIAKQLQDSELTAAIDRAVTFSFASPELLQDAPITTATDVWQLGILLHLLLSGSHPFGVVHDMSLAKQLQQLAREPEPLTKAALQATAEQAAERGEADAAALAKAMHGGLEAVIATCLRRDPTTRYASIDALAADLGNWLGNRPVSAANIGSRERARLWLRRNRLLAACVSTVAVVLVAATGVSLWQAREARRESVKARASLQFLADTLGAAAPEQALNSEVSVRQLLDSARRQLEQRGIVDPQVRQPVQRMLGRLYFSIGDFRQAVELLDAGSKDVGPDTRDEALALADDLDVYSDVLGGLEQGAVSVAVSERAADLRMRFAPDDPEQRLRALAHQTLGHVERYGWDACRKRAEEALAMALRMPNPPVDVVLRLYSDLGSVANFTNDRSRLIQLSEQGLAFADQHQVPAESPLRFTLLRNRIEGLLLAGRITEAEALSREAIALAEKTGGVGLTRLAVLYSTLGNSLRDQGRYREAQAALQRALDLTPRANAGPRNIAVALGNLALVHAVAGDSATGLRLASQARDELDQAGIAIEDTFRISLELTYVRVLLAGGRWTIAATHIEELLALVRRTQGEDSDQYAMLLAEEVEAARQARDVVHGRKQLAVARARAAGRGISENHPTFARFLRDEAAFARMDGDLPTAERLQRESLENLELTHNAFEVAVAQSELAQILADRRNRIEASALLAQAVPVLQREVLPQQADLRAAEALASEIAPLSRRAPR
ncbi:MAG: serine/threonine-protein kinase [Gammaproteobacteria bacterium]